MSDKCNHGFEAYTLGDKKYCIMCDEELEAAIKKADHD